jgi:hypothetical protein
MHTHSTNLFPEDTVELDMSNELHTETRPETENVVGGTVAARVEESIIKKLSFLDRFLALWILLAMICGILLGCFVPGIENVLDTAQLIGVSAPIGTSRLPGPSLMWD